MTYRWARVTPHMINVYDNRIYEESKTESWVFGILKKQLEKLGVTIIKTKNFNGDWGFLLSNDAAELVSEKYPKPIYKDGRIDWEATDKRDREKVVA